MLETCIATLAFDRRVTTYAIDTKFDLAPQCTSPRVSLGGEGMIHHKKWPMELVQEEKKKDEAVPLRLNCVFLLAVYPLIAVYV